VVEIMMEKCERDKFGLFVGIARRIWFQINKVVHGGKFLHPNPIARGAIVLVEEYKKANLTETVSPTESKSGIYTTWKAPPKGYYKVNWDVDVDKFNGHMRIGIVVRDNKGFVHAAISRSEQIPAKPAP
jgi:hypothetical protein